MKAPDKTRSLPFPAILRRARILFAVLLILTIASTSSSLVLGWKSGEFEKRIIAPVKTAVNDFFVAMTEETEEKPSSPSGSWKKYVDTTPTPQAKRGASNGGTRIIIVTPKPQTGTSTYDRQVQQMNEWSAQQQANQDAWWEEQQKNFEATKQQNNAWFEAEKARQQQEMEQFQAEHGL